MTDGRTREHIDSGRLCMWQRYDPDYLVSRGLTSRASGEPSCPLHRLRAGATRFGVLGAGPELLRTTSSIGYSTVSALSLSTPSI